mgnify:CR=1 FL=1
MESHKEVFQSNLLSLHERIGTIQKKMLNSINLNRVISNAFYDHFENFTLVLQSSTFFADMENNFKNMVQQCKKFKGPGI